MTYTVVMGKAGTSGNGQVPVVDPAKKVYVSISGKPLSEAGVAQALAIRDAFKEVKFEQVFCGDSRTAYETAVLATGGTLEAPGNVIVEKDFNQIRLGIHEGKEAGAIQEEYAKAHPKEFFVPEPNDTMREPWDGYAKDAFETYPEMDERVCSGLAKLNLGAKYFVAAAKEPVRTAMLEARLDPSLRKSKFYKDLVAHIQRIPEPNRPLKDFAVRGQLDPRDGSWISLRFEGKVSYLVAVSDGVGFRPKPPVSAYVRDVDVAE